MLNFDPDRWLAEREGQGVATVATVAGVTAENELLASPADVVEIEWLRERSGGIRKNANSSVTPATPATVATNPTAFLRDWHRHLSTIDQLTSPPGWTIDAWLTLTDDAFYVYEHFGSIAVRAGWSALDLFAVRPGMPHRGGLADMLDGARNLKLDGPRAYWSAFGVPFRINVGCGLGGGAVLLWALDRTDGVDQC